jgi:hypothetical protein
MSNGEITQRPITQIDQNAYLYCSKHIFPEGRLKLLQKGNEPSKRHTLLFRQTSFAVRAPGYFLITVRTLHSYKCNRGTGAWSTLEKSVDKAASLSRWGLSGAQHPASLESRGNPSVDFPFGGANTRPCVLKFPPHLTSPHPTGAMRHLQCHLRMGEGTHATPFCLQTS